MIHYATGSKLLNRIGARLESANEEWWSKLSPEQQGEYLRDHPNSKKAKEMKSEEERKSEDKPVEKSPKVLNTPREKVRPINEWEYTSTKDYQKYGASSDRCFRLNSEGYDLRIYFTREGSVGVIDGEIFSKVDRSPGGSKKLAKDMQLHVRSLGPKQGSFNKKQLTTNIDSVRNKYGVKEENSSGFCAVVCYDLFSNNKVPKGFAPYSCEVGEEEHVILYDKKTGDVIDPTGDQFDFPVFDSKPDRSKYRGLQKLSKQELESVAKEADGILVKRKGK